MNKEDGMPKVEHIEECDLDWDELSHRQKIARRTPTITVVYDFRRPVEKDKVKE